MAGIRSSFRLLEDKPCSSEIKQMKWSPTMDLLAAITKEGEIWLQRLSWQRVWSISADESNTCTCLTWRSDGKILAAGFADGSLKLFDVEDTECIHSFKLDSSIQCMEWTKQQGTQTSKSCQFYQDTSDTYLPQLKGGTSKVGSSTTFPKENATARKEDPKRLKKASQDLSILVVGDATGKVHFLIHGIFLCASLSTHDSLGAHECAKVLSAVISTDYKLLSVVVEISAEEEGSKNYAYLVYNTTLLSSRSEEIGVVSYKYGQIVTLMEQFEETLQRMTEAWEEILLEIDSKLTKFSESTDPEKTIGDEFLTLFTCGVASPEMQQFLVHELTEKGLKKLGTSIDHSYTNIQNLTMKQLQSLEDALMFHITDLLGMSRWYDKFGILGLTEATVQKSINVLGAFVLKTREMLQVIDSSTKSFKAFFKWIYVVLLRFLDEPIPNCIRQSSDKEVDLVLQFLDEHLMKKGKDSKFTVEKVGQYLIEDDLKTVQDTSKNVLADLLNFCPALRSSPLIFPDHSHKSLRSSFKILSESVQEVFKKPLSDIGASVSNIGCVPLIQFSHDVKAVPCVTQRTLQSPLMHTVVFSNALELSGDVYIMSVPTSQMFSNQPMRVHTRKCHFQLPDSDNIMQISDLVFYTDETLTMLLQHERYRNDVESVLVQFPVSSLKDLISSEVLSSDPKLITTCLVETDLIPQSTNAWDCITHSRSLSGMLSRSVAVSGTRKVSAVLSSTCTRVRLFDMDAEDEEEDNEGDIAVDDCSVTPVSGGDNEEDKENKGVMELEESDGSL